VIRDARRDGVARALLERLEQAARMLGYRQLVLETGVRQVPAIALYSRCGWRRIAPFGPYVGDPTSVCFGKALVPPR
jgi:GNAT superfamily N-acetyltransferase